MRPPAGRPASRVCSSSRISPASARRTRIRTRVAPSSASRCATTAARSSRAVLEGVAYGLRDSLELVRGLGVHAEVGRVSGGGARSSLWLRIVASVLGLPLERTAASEDGAAFGAALLAGVASGAFADAAEAVAACVHVTDRIEPEPAWQGTYDDGYVRFRELYPALRPLEGP